MNSNPRAFGIQTGLSVVKHEPAELGFCSLRTFTFDAEGRPTVSVLDLEQHQAARLRDALNDALNDGGQHP